MSGFLYVMVQLSLSKGWQLVRIVCLIAACEYEANMKLITSRNIL